LTRVESVSEVYFFLPVCIQWIWSRIWSWFWSKIRTRILSWISFWLIVKLILILIENLSQIFGR